MIARLPYNAFKTKVIRMTLYRGQSGGNKQIVKQFHG